MDFKFKCPNCGKTITEQTGCVHFPVKNKEKNDNDAVDKLKSIFNMK